MPINPYALPPGPARRRRLRALCMPYSLDDYSADELGGRDERVTGGDAQAMGDPGEVSQDEP